MMKSDKPPQERKLYWPMQMGEPLKTPNFSQQQCKCNKRQLGSEPAKQSNEQMH